MAALQYLGRNPDSDSTITTKGYDDTANAVVAVTTSVVNTKIAAGAAQLTDSTYVNAQDTGLAKKTAVTAADANYVAASLRAAASGIASLDSSGNLTSSQVPTGIKTDQVMLSYPGTIASGFTAAHTVTSTTLREFKLASVIIPDPGFPWRPWPFAVVAGNSSSASNPGRGIGNGNFGQLTVVAPSGVSDTVHGLGLCLDSYYTNYYTVAPYGSPSPSAVTPSTSPAISGGRELDLWGCCSNPSTTYVFLPDNLTFWVYVVPSF